MRRAGPGSARLIVPNVNPPSSQTSSTRPSSSSPRRRLQSWWPFMRGLLLLLMDHFNDWDLQAVVRSCSSFSQPEEPAAGPRDAAAPAPAASKGEAVAVRGPVRASVAAVAKDTSLLYDLEYLDLDHKPFLLPPTTSSRAGDDGREVMISFPAAADSTSGMQPRAVPPGRKPGERTPRPKRSKKSQLKKVVREMPVADGGVSSSDPCTWRKYGQKPIKGSPYPRGYYKCSSMKGCMARKLVERSPAKPGVLIVTYMAEHCHPVPAQLNALAGTTRHKFDADSNEAAAMAVECGAEEAAAAADNESEFWPAGMELDELLDLAPVDDDFDFDHVMDEDDGVLGRRISL